MEEKEYTKQDLLEAIAFYALVVMTEIEQDGKNIIPHLIDSDDNPGQHLRSLLLEYGKGLEKTAYAFLLNGDQIKNGGYSSIEEIIAVSKVRKS